MFAALPGNNPITYGPGNAPMLTDPNPPLLFTNVTVTNNPKRKREQSLEWHKRSESLGWHKRVVKRFGSSI